MEAGGGGRPAGAVGDSGRRLALLGLALLAATMACINLWQDWYADPYFAAAVRSMGTSWHAFFFVSFDPAGFISVDKPPLALWLQTGATKLLGFHWLSLLLPAALAGLGSVALLYHLVRRAFGAAAGMLAALFLIFTPVSVAVDRSNNMDALCALCALAGAWAIGVAAETGRIRPLLLCAVALGLGFNAKFLQAWVVLPAFALVYALAPMQSARRRLAGAAAAALVLVAVSFGWVAAVDLTPAGQRPYVGSSSNNTELDLALGYNGLGRIVGGSAVAGAASAQVGDAAGDPGPLRLLNRQLGGQIGWLLPLALFGLAEAARAARATSRTAASARGRRTAEAQRPGFLEGRQRQALALWGGWLLSLVLVYSVSSYFHPYNVVMLAAPVCALAGIGVVALWRAYLAGRRWPLLGALLVTALLQGAIALQGPDWQRWLVVLAVTLALAAAAFLAITPRLRQARDRLRAGTAAALGVLALLILPAAWSSVPLWHYGLPEFPIAGPDLLDASLDPPATTRAFFAPPSLTAYLLAQRHGERYLLATRYGGVAAPLLLATGRAVLTYGGYLGTDQILSADQLARMARSGEVRYFLLLPQPGGATDAPAIERWVRGRCLLVRAALWQPPRLYGNTPPQLYDCAHG